MTTDNREETKATEDDLHEGLLFAGKDQREAFEAKFGRSPTEEDPWYFDPAASTPQAYSRDEVRNGTAPICDWLEQIANEAEYQAELWKAIVYSTRKTGLVLDQFSYLRASEADRLAYDMALQECSDASPSEIKLCVKTLQ